MSSETDPNAQNPNEPNPAATAPEDTSPPATAEALMAAATQRIGALEAELAEMRERWMRAEAEGANIRARAKRDVDETRQYAVQKFATDVVEAAENLRRGFAALPPASPDEPGVLAKLREGLDGIERNLQGVLERNGIAREDPTGSPFDPNRHQAMAEQENTDAAPGTVLAAWTSAWTLNGRLLRPAMVVVARAPAGKDANPGAGIENDDRLNTSA